MWVDPESELVFLGASSRVLYAIDIATGALRWSWSGARSVFESVIGADGRVHVETSERVRAGGDLGTKTRRPVPHAAVPRGNPAKQPIAAALAWWCARICVGAINLIHRPH